MQIVLAEFTIPPEYQLLIFYQLLKDDLQLGVQVRKEKSQSCSSFLEFISVIKLYPGIFLPGVLSPVNTFKTGAYSTEAIKSCSCY